MSKLSDLSCNETIPSEEVLRARSTSSLSGPLLPPGASKSSPFSFNHSLPQSRNFTRSTSIGSAPQVPRGVVITSIGPFTSATVTASVTSFSTTGDRLTPATTARIQAERLNMLNRCSPGKSASVPSPGPSNTRNCTNQIFAASGFTNGTFPMTAQMHGSQITPSTYGAQKHYRQPKDCYQSPAVNSVLPSSFGKSHVDAPPITHTSGICRPTAIRGDMSQHSLAAGLGPISNVNPVLLMHNYTIPNSPTGSMRPSSGSADFCHGRSMKPAVYDQQKTYRQSPMSRTLSNPNMSVHRESPLSDSPFSVLPTGRALAHLQNPMTTPLPGSPTSLYPTLATPSPRTTPAILRKGGSSGSAAKRKLADVSTVSASSSPSPAVRSIIQTTGNPSVTSDGESGTIANINNLANEESPRKRARKQQFGCDDNQDDKIKLAISTEAIHTPVWKLPVDHPSHPENANKKRRGKGKVEAQETVQTGVRHIFVDLDSENLKRLSDGEFGKQNGNDRTHSMSGPLTLDDIPDSSKKEHKKRGRRRIEPPPLIHSTSLFSPEDVFNRLSQKLSSLQSEHSEVGDASRPLRVKSARAASDPCDAAELDDEEPCTSKQASNLSQRYYKGPTSPTKVPSRPSSEQTLTPRRPKKITRAMKTPKVEPLESPDLPEYFPQMTRSRRRQLLQEHDETGQKEYVKVASNEKDLASPSKEVEDIMTEDEKKSLAKEKRKKAKKTFLDFLKERFPNTESIKEFCPDIDFEALQRDSKRKQQRKLSRQIRKDAMEEWHQAHSYAVLANLQQSTRSHALVVMEHTLQHAAMVNALPPEQRPDPPPPSWEKEPEKKPKHEDTPSPERQAKPTRRSARFGKRKTTPETLPQSIPKDTVIEQEEKQASHENPSRRYLCGIGEGVLVDGVLRFPVPPYCKGRHPLPLPPFLKWPGETTELEKLLAMGSREPSPPAVDLEEASKYCSPKLCYGTPTETREERNIRLKCLAIVLDAKKKMWDRKVAAGDPFKPRIVCLEPGDEEEARKERKATMRMLSQLRTATEMNERQKKRRKQSKKWFRKATSRTRVHRFVGKRCRIMRLYVRAARLARRAAACKIAKSKKPVGDIFRIVEKSKAFRRAYQAKGKTPQIANFGERTETPGKGKPGKFFAILEFRINADVRNKMGVTYPVLVSAKQSS